MGNLSCSTLKQQRKHVLFIEHTYILLYYDNWEFKPYLHIKTLSYTTKEWWPMIITNINEDCQCPKHNNYQRLDLNIGNFEVVVNPQSWLFIIIDSLMNSLSELSPSLLFLMEPEISSFSIMGRKSWTNSSEYGGVIMSSTYSTPSKHSTMLLHSVIAQCYCCPLLLLLAYKSQFSCCDH